MIDPVTLAVIRGRLEQIVDEMDATPFRAAFSPVIAEARDGPHGLYDASSDDTIAMGKTGLPVFIGAIARDLRTGMVSPERAPRDYPITIAPDGTIARNAA